MSEKTVRKGDMHPTRAIEVRHQGDGDVEVVISQDGLSIGYDTGDPKDRAAVVRFCVKGGRSRHTLQALVALKEAMMMDNQEWPIRP